MGSLITSDLIGKKINCTMWSGERRQGKLLELNEDEDTFTINWKRDSKDDHWFRTTGRLSRVESVTEIIHPPKDGNGQAPSEPSDS